jgi:hypothetical protein
MVATFGKVGLAPGQYLWAASVPAEGETKLVVDRLTQMLDREQRQDHAARLLVDPGEEEILPLAQI